MNNKDLIRRILDISYYNNLSHIGSCLSALPIIAEIYEKKKKHDPFVLSSGHAGLALYVVLEKHGFGDAEEIFHLHGVHPNRDLKHGIWCSTGSLGQGLPIALGMALANPTRQHYCLISDGECAEGSIWEALRIAQEQKVTNLKIYVNINGYGAYKEVDRMDLSQKLLQFSYWYEKNGQWEKNVEPVFSEPHDYPFLRGLDAHYHQMTQEEYETTHN